MQPDVRKLYRSREDRVLAGVCGGLGDYFRMDPIVFRFGFFILALMNGIGVIAYVVMALTIPEQTDNEERATDNEKGEVIRDTTTRNNEATETDKFESKAAQRMTLGFIVAGTAALLLFPRVIPHHWMRPDMGWALLLFIVGIALVWKGKNR